MLLSNYMLYQMHDLFVQVHFVNFMPSLIDIIIIIPAGICQSLGFSPGCCSLASSPCYVPTATCYCDPSCHIYGDCCSDVTLTLCSARSQRVSRTLKGESDPPSFSITHRRLAGRVWKQSQASSVLTSCDYYN